MIAELEALRIAALRHWWLEYDVDGEPFVWTGDARTEAAADQAARRALVQCAGFRNDAAQLVACLEC